MPVGVTLSLDYLKDHIYAGGGKIISKLFKRPYLCQ